jgi:hypothetical protein
MKHFAALVLIYLLSLFTSALTADSDASLSPAEQRKNDILKKLGLESKSGKAEVQPPAKVASKYDPPMSAHNLLARSANDERLYCFLDSSKTLLPFLQGGSFTTQRRSIMLTPCCDTGSRIGDTLGFTREIL